MAKPPKQKPGKSEQIVCTPDDFLLRLQEKFGPIEFDLAANAANAIVPAFYGPSSPFAEDALNVSWPKTCLNFINPPFGMIKGKNGFAWKAWHEMTVGAETLMLVPAAVGSNWFRDYVLGKADVYFLNPRLTFKNHTQVYPKDLLLCHYKEQTATPKCTMWEWDKH